MVNINNHCQLLQAASVSQEDDTDDDSQPTASTSGNHSFLESAKYIPLRLSHDERRYLRLLEAALSVSEYTDKVDVISWKSKNQRINAQIRDICAILCGLVVASDYKKGQQLVRVSHCVPLTHAKLLAGHLFEMKPSLHQCNGVMPQGCSWQGIRIDVQLRKER